MQFKNYIQTKLPFFVALSFAFVLASCGSYQYVGYDNDGIYSDDEVIYTEAETTTETSDNSYYKDYFAEKTQQYDNIPNDESVIFIDIDSYEGNYNEEIQEDVQTGYAGWGQASDNVTINVYDNGWYNRGWGGFGAGWYNPYWGGYSPFYGYGFNNWGWNSWGWNSGFFGYGYGFGYNNFWCPPGYYNGYYANTTYRRNIAYNTGRRGYNASSLNRNYMSRRNSSTVMRRSSNALNNRSRANINSTRRSTNSIRSRSNTRINSNTTRRTTRPRINTTTRRTSPTVRRNSGSSRSSSSVRSSGSSRSSSSARSRGSSSSRSSGSSSRSSSGRRGN